MLVRERIIEKIKSIYIKEEIPLYMQIDNFEDYKISQHNTSTMIHMENIKTKEEIQISSVGNTHIHICFRDKNKNEHRDNDLPSSYTKQNFSDHKLRKSTYINTKYCINGKKHRKDFKPPVIINWFYEYLSKKNLEEIFDKTKTKHHTNSYTYNRKENDIYYNINLEKHIYYENNEILSEEEYKLKKRYYLLNSIK